MAYSDLITMQELSPELRQLISMGGGVSTSGGMIVVDDIYTQKIEATIEEQTEFEIPFKQYDSVNSYLDIKINSTWINPSRYSIVDNKVVFNEGVPLGTFVYFTIFSLAQPTGDGGYIENVEVAETPQEVIVYDGEIINEKVNEAVASHNTSGEAHADIRNIVDLKANKTYVDTYTLMKNNSITTFTTDIECGMYYVNDSQDGTFPYHYGVLTVFDGGASERTAMFSTTGNDRKTYMNYWVVGSEWIGWKEMATTETTTTLDNKIGVLNTERGYLTSVVVNDTNEIKLNGKYILTASTINKPDNGYDWYACDATFEQSGITGRLTATCFAGGNMGKTYTRINLHGTWYEWRELFSTGVYSSITNLDDLSENGIYDVSPNTLNSPLVGEYSKCLVFQNPDINAISQTLFKTSGGGSNVLYIRQSYFKDGAKKWQDWQQVATTSKINILDGQILNGWAFVKALQTDVLTISKSGNIVCANFKIKNTLGSSNWSTVFSMPIGYRPKNHSSFVLDGTHNLICYPDGVVQVDNASPANVTYNVNIYFEAQ